MKNLILLTTCLLLCGQPLFSQTTGKNVTNYWCTEYGYAFTGSGDISGYSLHSEYGWAFSEKFKIAPAIGVMNFHQNTIETDKKNILLKNANARSLELMGYVTPAITNRLGFELGFGSFVRHWRWIYATGPLSGYGSGDIHLGSSDYATAATTGVGYSISIGFMLKVSGHIGLSLRGVYQNDTNYDNAVTARLGLNIGF